MYLDAEEPPADQPGILMLWIASNQNWQTWWGTPDGMVDKIQQDSLAGWLPTSISLARSPSGDRIMRSHTKQLGIGNRAHFDLSLEDFRELVGQYRERGWRPQLMQVQVGGKDFRCVCVFRENRAKSRWDVSIDTTERELEAELERRQKEGFYPLSIGSYVQANAGGELEPRYIVVWMEATAGM
jgi:hypothetical protein